MSFGTFNLHFFAYSFHLSFFWQNLSAKVDLQGTSYPKGNRILHSKQNQYLLVIFHPLGWKIVVLYLQKYANFHVAPPAGARSSLPCDLTPHDLSAFPLRYWKEFHSIYPLADLILCLRQWRLLERKCSWLVSRYFLKSPLQM